MMKKILVLLTSLFVMTAATIGCQNNAFALDLRTGSLSIDYLKMQQLSDETAGTPDSSSLVFKGLMQEESKGNNVRELQEKLTDLGYFSDEIDGVYGETTKAAVEKFQEENGLIVDGMVGLFTINTINGVENMPLEQIATYINEQLGNDILKAFLYASQYPYVVHDADNLDKKDIPAACFEHLISSHTADCYCMAATFYYLALDLGLDAHMVMGEVPLNDNQDNMAAHSWVEVDYPEGTRCYDPQSFNERGYAGYAFEYGEKHTWKYMNYERIN